MPARASRRFTLLLTVTCATILAGTSAGVAQQTTDAACRLDQSSRGFIIATNPSDALLDLVRDGNEHHVPAHCYLHLGDTLHTPPGVTATVKLPNEERPMHEVEYLMVIANNVSMPRWFAVVSEAIDEMWPTDTDEAWKLAHARIAASRDARSMLTGGSIVLPGVGPAQQTLPTGAELLLRWTGGRPPFHVDLSAAVGSQAAVSESSVRSAKLDLSAFTPGTYKLTISGAAGIPLNLPLRLVAATEIPAAPHADETNDPHARALLQSVWLLTHGDPSWRLAALSGLYGLAAENDMIAQSIVGVPDAAR